MLWRLEHVAPRTNLQDLSVAHYSYSIAQPLDYSHVVRDEQTGDACLPLNVKQQVAYPSLY